MANWGYNLLFLGFSVDNSSGGKANKCLSLRQPTPPNNNHDSVEKGSLQDDRFLYKWSFFTSMILGRSAFFVRDFLVHKNSINACVMVKTLDLVISNLNSTRGVTEEKAILHIAGLK